MHRRPCAPCCPPPRLQGGHIYVIDSDATTNCSIRKFDPNGTVVLSFGSCGEEVDQVGAGKGFCQHCACGKATQCAANEAWRAVRASIGRQTSWYCLPEQASVHRTIVEATKQGGHGWAAKFECNG